MRGAVKFALLSVIAGGTLWAVAFGGLQITGSASRAQAFSVVSGDLDCSGIVDASDVTGGLAGTAGLDAQHACMAYAGDVNCSGLADVVDILQLLRHLAGVAVQAAPECPAVGSTFEPAPTTQQLIEQALTDHEITQGQAFVYELYADFGDPGLPEQYKGTSLGIVESSLFRAIQDKWSTLSSQEQAALQPYLLPPAAPGSWLEQREAASSDVHAAAIQWQTMTGTHIKVWRESQRPEDEAKAQAALNAIEGTIWPKEVGLMGGAHAPPSDAGQANNGGDGLFDVYLVHIQPDTSGDPPVDGFVTPYGGCKLTPSYMVLNSSAAVSADYLAVVAHEFFHAIQFTYDVGSCGDYDWAFESTATWAEDFVYPKVNEEQGFAPSFLNQLDVPLEKFVYKDPRQYGAYLFFFFLSHQLGGPDTVRDFWNASGNPDSLAAIQSTVQDVGGFEDVWPQFELYNWNRPPYDQYTQWDKLAAFPPFNSTDVSAEGSAQTYDIATDVGHMGAYEYHYFVQDSVKSFTFVNPFAGAGQQYAKVQAMLKIGGQWQGAADWTDKDRVHFCLDKPEEHVEEIVLVISNSNYTDRNAKFNVGKAQLEASPVGCLGWSGTVTSEVYYFDARFKVTVGNVLFQKDESQPPNERYTAYKLVDATDITWHAEGTWPGGCQASGTMHLDPPGSGLAAAALGFFVTDAMDTDYAIGISGHDFDPKLTITCPDGSFELGWPVIPVIWDGGLGIAFKDEGGVLVADGEFTDPTMTYGGHWTWRLTEVK